MARKAQKSSGKGAAPPKVEGKAPGKGKGAKNTPGKGKAPAAPGKGKGAKKTPRKGKAPPGKGKGAKTPKVKMASSKKSTEKKAGAAAGEGPHLAVRSVWIMKSKSSEGCVAYRGLTTAEGAVKVAGTDGVILGPFKVATAENGTLAYFDSGDGGDGGEAFTSRAEALEAWPSGEDVSGGVANMPYFYCDTPALTAFYPLRASNLITLPCFLFRTFTQCFSLTPKKPPKEYPYTSKVIICEKA
jgi:hypothetical protein